MVLALAGDSTMTRLRPPPPPLESSWAMSAAGRDFDLEIFFAISVLNSVCFAAYESAIRAARIRNSKVDDLRRAFYRARILLTQPESGEFRDPLSEASGGPWGCQTSAILTGSVSQSRRS